MINRWVHPDFPGSWKPPLFAQSFSHHPLHPHWGENRTFVPVNSTISLPEMIAYDTTENSAYFQQFLAVYKKDKTLTQAEKEAAIWWGDDPDETFTPPGHSYYIATIALKTKQPELIKCAETYAKVGMAVADAFINCWKMEIPFLFQKDQILLFPNLLTKNGNLFGLIRHSILPSGHAIQAAASMTVMTEMYGDQFTFTDRAHEGRERDVVKDTDFVVRHFDSFSEVAKETADSRFYGGIHTAQDNDVGLVEGARIANNVNQLKWKK